MKVFRPSIAKLAFAALAALTFSVCASGTAWAQRASTLSTKKEYREDHASDAAEWYNHFVNPTNDPNFAEKRVKGLEELKRMSNPAAMKEASTAGWTLVGATGDGKQGGSQDSRVSGRGQCLAVDKNGVIYYGPPLSGLWKTSDKGNTWVALSDKDWATQVIGGVAVDPVDPNVVYAGTGCPWGSLAGGGNMAGVGVYKSTDAGANWTLVWKNSLVSCAMAVNPSNTKLVYLASNSGVALSQDAGANWKSVCQLSGQTSLAVDPIDNSIVYAAGGGKLEKSVDSGKTWTVVSGVTSGSTMVVSLSPANHNYVYVSVSVGGGQGGTSVLCRSTDAGQTWSTLLSIQDKAGSSPWLGQQGYYANAIAVNPNNADEAILGGLDIYSATNAGSTYSKLTDWTSPSSNGNYAHADVHLLQYFGNTLYALTDGGIYSSTNNGASWDKSLNSYLPTLQFVGCDALLDGNGNPKYFVGGAQDNGLMKFTLHSTDKTWTQIRGGDGGVCYISQDDAGAEIYGTYIYDDIRRHTGADLALDHGWTDQSLLPSGLVKAPFYIEYMICDQDHQYSLICGTNGLFMSTDDFGTVNLVAGSTSSNKLAGYPTCATFGATDNTFIVTGTSGNAIYYSQDGASSFTKSTSAIGGTPTAICTDSSSQIIYAAVSGSKKFVRSLDGGVTFTAPATNLPSLNYNAVATSGRVVFLGNDFGVLYSLDSGVTWTPLTDGLPRCLVMRLKVRGHYLMATTYGRGMFYYDINTLLGINSVASAASDPNAAQIESVYPNPVEGLTGRATLRFSLAAEGRTMIQAFDELGREERVLENAWYGSGEHETSLDLAGLPAGHHFIMLTANGRIVTKAITVR